MLAAIYIMNIIQSTLFRALCAIVIGALLVKYRDDMVTWLTISIGALFFLMGIISCINYLVQKRRISQMERDGIILIDPQGKKLRNTTPFPLAGIGSIILGVLLAIRPETFIEFGTYIFAAVIILGTLTRFVSLAYATQYGKISLWYWIMPVLLFFVAIAAIVYPTLIASAPFFFIGWCFMIYGISEIINGIKMARMRRKASETASDTVVTKEED